MHANMLIMYDPNITTALLTNAYHNYPSITHQVPIHQCTPPLQVSKHGGTSKQRSHANSSSLHRSVVPTGADT